MQLFASLSLYVHYVRQSLYKTFIYLVNNFSIYFAHIISDIFYTEFLNYLIINKFYTFLNLLRRRCIIVLDQILMSLNFLSMQEPYKTAETWCDYTCSVLEQKYQETMLMSAVNKNEVADLNESSAIEE